MFGLSGKYESLVEKVDRSQRLSRDEASVLAGAPLALLGLLASRVKERKSGREVYYNRNFHIEPTNICVFNCRFCSYRRPAGASDAWDYSEEEILAQVEQDAKRRFPKAHPHLTDKVRDGGVWADQGVIAGCSGGLFDNITEAADILRVS